VDRAASLGWLAVLILAGALGATHVARGEAVVRPRALDVIPLVLGGWLGEADPAVDRAALRTAGADAVLARTYWDRGDSVRVALAYWKRQDRGDVAFNVLNAAESPRWRLVSRWVRTLSIPSVGAVPVSFLLLEHEGTGARELVGYYYVEAGDRYLASEYRGRMFTLLDGLLRRRSDVVLVTGAAALRPDRDRASVEARVASFLEALAPAVDAWVRS
jgi:EpsI family protein